MPLRRDHRITMGRQSLHCSRGPQLPSRPGEFHPESLTEPYVNLSIHTARATARRLPPSTDCRAPPVAGWPDRTAMACPFAPRALPRLITNTDSPPLSGASVLLALRLEPLE